MTILRVACYERVSTEEQAIHGYSIKTQIDNLTDYCQEKNLKIIGHYTDEGISGAKPPLKRPALQQLLDDVEAGKVDMVLFTKLDRWFRSVKEYYKVQDLLDRHNVQWKAIHEDYDTSTPNGQFAITIFLAVAQQERDKTADRVKRVLEHKRKNKEACFGGPNKPMGYIKQKDENGIRRLIKDPKETQMTEEFWAILIKYNNLNKAIRHMNDVYGVTKSHKTWLRIARNEIYCGIYKGVEDYCEPYVSKADWVKLQEEADKRIRDTKAKRVYMFAGMIRCPECGHILCGTSTPKNYKSGRIDYLSYRCRFKSTTCNYKRTLSEKKIENYLIANLAQFIDEEILKAKAEKSKPKPKPKYNLPALKERLRRLNVTYMAGNKSDEEYLQEDAEIKALIAKAENEAPPPERDLEPLKEVLNSGFESVYFTMDAEEKRRFWRSIIKEIQVEGLNVKDVIFF